MRSEKFIENFLIPLIIAFSVFLFLPSNNYYIFGQDSLPFFGQFTFYQNPLFEFNNGIEMVYFSLFSEFFIHIFSNVTLSQRILIFLATYLSVIGFFDLIDVIAQLSNKVERTISKSLGAMLFLYNPFTLSITWAHFAGWSLLILLSPFIISFLTNTVYNGGNIRRFSLTSLLTMVFVGGLVGGFYPFFLLIVAVFLIFLFYNMMLHISDRNALISMIRRMIYIIAFVGVSTLWALIPLYQGTFSSISSSFNGSYLIRFFLGESSTTTLPNVLSLTGYSWLYEVSNAYPWMSSFSQLQASAYILLFFIPTILIILKKFQKIFPLTLIALLAVVFSTGSNFPFGFINEHLLLLKGPFLFLVNAYYFVLQFYVLFLAVLLSLVFYRLVAKDKQEEPSTSKWNIHNFFPKLRANYQKILAVVLILFMTSTFFYPFATGQIYQKNGPNIDAIDINNGLLGLGNYLRENYSTPDYYTLLIPTSSGGVYLTYNNNSTFKDSRGLISTVDPYPLIWQNNSYLAESVENYLSSGNFQNLAGALTYLHIKYVIFTSHYSIKYPSMVKSPNGHYYNFTGIYDALASAFGNPIRFGSYYVFTNSFASPTLQLVTHPVLVNTTLTKYLDFLGSIDPSKISKTQLSILYHAIISNKISNNGKLQLLKPLIQNVYEIPANNSYLLMYNGTIENPISGGFTPSKGKISITPLKVASISNTSSYSTDMLYANNRLSANQSSYLSINPPMDQPSSFKFLFKLYNLPYKSRDFFNFKFGNVTLSAQFINLSRNGSSMVLSLIEYFPGRAPFAWKNILIPANSVGNNISFSGQINSNYSLTIHIQEASLGFNTSVNYFFYGSNNYYSDPGYNASNFQPDFAIPNQYELRFNTGGDFPIVFYNFTIFKEIPIEYILLENLSSLPQIQNISIQTSIFGNYYLTNITTNDTSYLCFFGPPQGNWNAYIQGSSGKLPIFDNNRFSYVYKISPRLNSISIHIEYQSLAPQMFSISLIEFVVLIIVLIMSFCYEINKNWKDKSKNKR